MLRNRSEEIFDLILSTCFSSTPDGYRDESIDIVVVF